MNVKQLLAAIQHLNPKTVVVIKCGSGVEDIKHVEYNSVLHLVEITTTEYIDPADDDFND